MTDGVDGDQRDGADRPSDDDQCAHADDRGAETDDPGWEDDYLDEQLAAHDPSGEPVGPGKQPMSRFRHGSLGVTLGAAMTGLGNVLEPRKKEEAPVVVEHDEPDHSHDPVELRLDRDDPGASVVIIRKWVEEHPDRAPREERNE